MIDGLTPPPTGNVNFGEACRIIGDHLTIHGLLDPTHWLTCHAEVIRENIHKLIKKEVKKKPFVLCTAADGIPGLPLEKFNTIRETIRKYEI